MTCKNESGFTLIEAVLAMGLFAVGLLALAALQIHFAEGNARSRQITRAADIVANKIEELSGITDPEAPALDPAGNPHGETVRSYPIDYFISWEVTGNGDRTRTIDFTAAWSTGERPREITIRWIKDL